ncbi:unnamed protein product, partial [Scytosiphon promiscuus]
RERSQEAPQPSGFPTNRMVETLEDFEGGKSIREAGSAAGEGEGETGTKKMDSPQVSPAPRSPIKEPPPLPSRHHSREPSHGSQFSEQFSEHNPLTGKDLSTLGVMEEEPKKPQAVALHGWQRTVGADDDFDATIPVCLGAPGTGLATAQVPHGGGTLVSGLGRGKMPRQRPETDSAPGHNKPTPALGAMVDLGNVKVTRADKKEAKSLRVQPAAPGAAPLPYPRIADVSETEDSSIETDEDEDDDDPTGQGNQSERHRPFDTQSSSASSDMSFLVNTAAGAFFGTRQTFGRAVEPRIPATVGEERLHNSLAQYFGKSRKTTASADGSSATGDGGETRSLSMSMGGAAAASAAGAAAAAVGAPAGGDTGRLIRQRSAGASGGAPTGAAAEGGSGCDGTEIAVLSANYGGSGSGSTMNTSNSLSGSFVAKVREISGGAESKRGESSANGGGRGRGRGGDVEAPGAKSRTAEERTIVKQASFNSGSEVPVEPGRRAPKCNCLRRWPWKILSGAATFVGVVSVVVLVLVASSGSSSSESRRLFLSPQLLSPGGGPVRPPSSATAPAAASGGAHDGGGGRGYSGGGPDGIRLGFSLSRRRLLAGDRGGGSGGWGGG